MDKKNLTIVDIKVFRGFAYGLRSPSLQISVDINKKISSELITSLFSELASISQASVAGLDLKKAIFSNAELFDSLLIILSNIIDLAKVPVFDKGSLIDNDETRNPNRLILLLPTCIYGDQYIISVLRWLFELVNKAVDGFDYKPELENILKLSNRPKFLGVFGSNFIHFISAARTMGIQVSFVFDKVFQFGQGKNGHWMESSFTEDTSHLGVMLARNKMATSAVLKSSGMPVPSHKLVKNANEAILAAKKIGYPVVIKPLDLDGGIGVAADIRSEKELTLAYEEAIKHSKKILLEKHIIGKDYRINVFHGKVLWAIERVYAGVWGDGITTLESLIEDINRDARRGDHNQSPLKKISIDKEMLDFLESRGLSLESIPEKNEFVQLRRRANISSGGLPIQVMDKVHEDNKMLAIRAARALKLDLAGVDLIIPDIARSWMEIGGAICEVNAQPQLGSVTSAHCYKDVLQGLVGKNGRIPILVVIGDEGEVFSQLASSYFEKKDIRVGLYSKSGLFVSNKLISNRARDFYSAGTVLCRDKNVGVIILNLKDLSVLQQGLPFDRFDALVVGGIEFLVAGDSPNGSFESLMQMLLPACEGNVFMDGILEKKVSAGLAKLALKPLIQLNSKSFVKSLCDSLLSKYNLLAN